jgi:hypothetical protein
MGCEMCYGRAVQSEQSRVMVIIRQWLELVHPCSKALSEVRLSVQRAPELKGAVNERRIGQNDLICEKATRSLSLNYCGYHRICGFESRGASPPVCRVCLPESLTRCTCAIPRHSHFSGRVVSVRLLSLEDTLHMREVYSGVLTFFV